mmetsp:Transcript_37568/g.96946  ORF Transcript_37568/g.96946 Transcript_37568/m.96946 type:complete len:108 (-) Transcript_37568:1240-1563(-)
MEQLREDTCAIGRSHTRNSLPSLSNPPPCSSLTTSQLEDLLEYCEEKNSEVNELFSSPSSLIQYRGHEVEKKKEQKKQESNRYLIYFSAFLRILVCIGVVAIMFILE